MCSSKDIPKYSSMDEILNDTITPQELEVISQYFVLKNQVSDSSRSWLSCVTEIRKSLYKGAL